MRLPVVPFVIATTLLAAVWYLFTATRPNHKTLDVPRLTRLADIDGIETEVAISPDGNRYSVVVSGDIWVLNVSTGVRHQITRTPEPESFPAWTPDGKRITFTRGSDTFAIDPDTGAEELFRKNATSLSWSSTSRTAFIRDRGLWIANPNDQDEKKLVEADAPADVTIEQPRFSPNSLQIAFIKTQLGLRGEVWVVDVLNGMAQALVSDRAAENPLDVGWINDGRDLVYLTNRAGAYSLWYVDFAQSTINPLTQPLVTVPLARIRMAVSQDRIVLPRHFVDSNIILSDGTRVAVSEKLEFEPAASPDGDRIAYTIADENKYEIWTAGLNGEKPTFRTLGREPRFSANGYQIVYTHTDLNGNADIWKLDIRNGSTERVTDAEEIDITADWSPDGRWIGFASARGGAISIWTIPASGGKRLRINDGGYAPRYSPDSKSILFWNRQALWTMDADGRNPRTVAGDLAQPTIGVWSKKGPAFFRNGEIRTASEKLFGLTDRLIWPAFDVLHDGRFVVAPIDVRETGLWAIDLTYKEN
jgi:Tol biopolymer transport system component